MKELNRFEPTKNVFSSRIFKDREEREPQFEQVKQKWYKPKLGLNVIRMLPVIDGRSSFIESSNHNFVKIQKEDGKIIDISPVCLRFLFNENEESCRDLYKKALASKKITADDKAKYKLYGCPICEIAKRVWKKSNKKDGRLFAASKCFMVIKDVSPKAENPDDLLMFGAPLSIWRAFAGQAQLYLENNEDPTSDKTGRNFLFNATGMDKERRYDSMMFSPKSTPFGSINGDIPDVDKVWLQGVRSFNEYLDMIKVTNVLYAAMVEFNLDFEGANEEENETNAVDVSDEDIFV